MSLQGQRLWHEADRHVLNVASVRLTTSAEPWAFAIDNAGAIDAHWMARKREQPSFFNGAVVMLASYQVTAEHCLDARFIRSDFKSFLYWRESGWPDHTVMDAFGSGLIFSAEGSNLLLAQQTDGHLNSGLWYPPSGFIDARDVTAGGTIDIDHSVRREIDEELGLGPDQLQRRPGYVVTFDGPVLSIGVPFVARLADNDLMSFIDRHITADANAELAHARLFAPGADTAQIAMPDYTRTLIANLVPSKSIV